MNRFKKMLSNARVRDNVEITVTGADGKRKQIFQAWRWVQKLIKHGYLSPLHAKIPVLFGYWSDRMVFSNGITNAGRAIISGLINGSGSPAAFTYIAVGTGTTAFSTSDTALDTETATSGLSRAAGTVSTVTTSVTNDTAQVLKSFTVTGTVAVTESGLFNASSSVTLLCRQTFSAINVVNGDTLQITWKVQNT
ncbi:MAG TPA: hypothetical protein VFX17_02165 [Patescibacteria group bacterium]|nr:hypothetical protein [Patescibacteria group bacterium]